MNKRPSEDQPNTDDSTVDPDDPGTARDSRDSQKSPATVGSEDFTVDQSDDEFTASPEGLTGNQSSPIRDEWTAEPPINEASADDPLATSAAPPGMTAEAPQLRGKHTSLPGNIGRYQTIGRLGEGSFGIVLKSRDPNLDRLVAVKLQKVNPVKSGGRIDRFMREARASAQLRHPHIVPVYEFGEYAGNHFIVYEFIEGTTLDRWMEENQPNVRSYVGLIAKLASALDYAHEQRIVHRDIKPANILIDAERQEPHIADFGCARQEIPDTERTVDGSLMGTPAYMSPEAVAGRANQADGRADQWALGVMLYEGLTGERPFKGKLGRIMQAIEQAAPKRPRQLNPSIPADLETIVLKCLEKDPDRRFPRCDELRADLHRWLQGRPIQARRVGVLERTWLWSKRNPITASLVALVATALILIAAGSAVFSMYLQQQRNEIVQRRVDGLATSAPQFLPTIIDDLATLDGELAEDQITQRFSTTTQPNVAFAYHLALAEIADVQGDGASESVQGILQYAVSEASPEELQIALQLKGRSLAEYNQSLWERARSEDNIRASCLLAGTDPDHDDWQHLEQPVLGFLLAEDAAMVPAWTRLLLPVSERFRSSIQSLFLSDEASVRQRAALIASELYQDEVPFLIQLGLQARPEQLQFFKNNLKRANWNQAISSIQQESLDEVGLTNVRLMLGLHDPSSVSRSLSAETPLAVRHRLICQMASAGISPLVLAEIIRQPDADDGTVAAAVLALGNYDLQQVYHTMRESWKPRLLELFQSHPSAGVHGASRWLLNQWGFSRELELARQKIQSKQPFEGFGWHEDVTGIGFAIFDTNSLRSSNSPAVRADNLPQRFGIGFCEITVDQFASWESRLAESWQAMANEDGENRELWETRVRRLIANGKNRQDSEQPRAPVTDISWYEAVLYCNGLTRQCGMAGAADVYEVGFRQKTEMVAAPAEGALEKLGYRLPLATEWELACRNGTTTRYFFGDSAELFSEFGWSVNNSNNELQPVAALKPNTHGLFDLLGNASEWCHNPRHQDPEIDSASMPKEVRGQSCAEEAGDIRISRRAEAPAFSIHPRRGFRVARTYPPEGEPPADSADKPAE